MEDSPEGRPGGRGAAIKGFLGKAKGHYNKFKGSNFADSMKNVSSVIGRNIKNGFSAVRNGVSDGMQHRMLRGLLTWFIAAIFLAIIFFMYPSFLIPAAIIVGIILILRSDFVKGNPVIQFLMILLLIGVVLYLFAPYVLGDSGLVGPKTFKDIVEDIAKSTAGVIESAKKFNPAEMWSNFMDKQVAYATGGYFEGQVEEGEKDTRLGIYLEDLQSADPLMIAGEEATFWITVRGKALEDVIPVKIGCNSTLGDENRVSKDEEYEIYSFEQLDYDCKFSSLPKGVAKITFWADYNFQTLGYNKAYFMGVDRLRTLRRQNIDPLDEYGIRDRDPTAVFTNGPIKLGIGTTYEQPIPIKKSGERMSVLGITVENRWEGKVKKINDLEIQVPFGIILRECDHNMTDAKSDGCIKRCEGNDDCETDCDNCRFYELVDDAKKKLGSVEKFQTIRCGMYSYADIIGDSPISTKYIRVIVDYDYVATSYKTFYVKERP